MSCKKYKTTKSQNAETPKRHNNNQNIKQPKCQNAETTKRHNTKRYQIFFSLTVLSENGALPFTISYATDHNTSSSYCGFVLAVGLVTFLSGAV